MDDDFQQLETELKGLRPAKPSRALVSRIENELAIAPKSAARSQVWWLWTVALPVAAGVAFVVVQFSPKRPVRSEQTVAKNPPSAAQALTVTANEAPLKPVAAENVLV